MRLAVWHNLPSGGGLRVLEDQLRGLASLGHELHIWAPPSAAPSEAIALATTTHEIALSRPSVPGGLRGLRFAWSGRRPDLDAFAIHNAQCAREISGIRPDVVLAHSCQYFRVPGIAPFLEAPSVLYLHEPNRRLYEAPFGFPWVANPSSRTTLRPASIRRFVAELVRVEQSRLLVRAETDWVDAFDEVLVNSLFCRESVLRAYGRLTRVSPPGIDTVRFPFQERPARLRGTVLFVGALVLEKNPEFLVRAVAAAGASVRRFIWVANYIDEQSKRSLENAAGETGISVEVRASVSDEELLRIYYEADVLVYAPRLEPFGLAPLEANATGLPVVAVAEGGVRETVVDGVNGMIVEHDVAAFGAAITSLLSDARGTRAFGRAAREHVVKHWPLERAVATLEGHLRSVASSKARVKPSSRGTEPVAKITPTVGR